MRLKRYLVFSYPDYYPSGGWNDFEQDFATVEEARAFINTLDSNLMTDLVDTETGEDIG